MTIAKAREKLHDFIDHADENRVFELLALFENTSNNHEMEYDGPTLNLLRERSQSYRSGKGTISLDKFKDQIDLHRKGNGV